MTQKPSERPLWFLPLLGFLIPVGIGSVFLYFQSLQWAQQTAALLKTTPTMEEAPNPSTAEPAALQKEPPTMEDTSSPSPPQSVGFTPGVEGWSSDEYCKSTSVACQKWTELARKCAENLRRREAGYMGRLEPYCTQAEELRERVTGIALSGAPGGYDF